MAILLYFHFIEEKDENHYYYLRRNNMRHWETLANDRSFNISRHHLNHWRRYLHLARSSSIIPGLHDYFKRVIKGRCLPWFLSKETFTEHRIPRIQEAPQSEPAVKLNVVSAVISHCRITIRPWRLLIKVLIDVRLKKKEEEELLRSRFSWREGEREEERGGVLKVEIF